MSGIESNVPAMPDAVLPHALAIPAFNKLAGKRIILASASPRRKEILKLFVCGPTPLIPTKIPTRVLGPRARDRYPGILGRSAKVSV